jgi:hypothetical protein
MLPPLRLRDGGKHERRACGNNCHSQESIHGKSPFWKTLAGPLASAGTMGASTRFAKSARRHFLMTVRVGCQPTKRMKFNALRAHHFAKMAFGIIT